MIDLNTVNNIYLYPGYIRMHCGIDGLVSLVMHKLGRDPYDGSLFVFCNKARTLIKILHFEHSGFWIYYKRFETGKIKWPMSIYDQCITRSDLKMLLQGMVILQKPMNKCMYRLVA